MIKRRDDIEYKKMNKNIYEEDKKKLKDPEVDSDSDEYEDRIIKDLFEAKTKDNFIIFKNAFNKRFITQKQSYKGRDYYLNTCVYQRGKFNVKYVINGKTYLNFFSMKDLASHKNGVKFFRKIFKEDKTQKVQDLVMQDIKSDIYYYRLDFFIFKTILCRYLFEFKQQKGLKIWDTDFNIFSLLENDDFISVLDRLDVDTKIFKNQHDKEILIKC